jgi:hypothetical protein
MTKNLSRVQDQNVKKSKVVIDYNLMMGGKEWK